MDKDRSEPAKPAAAGQLERGVRPPFWRLRAKSNKGKNRLREAQEAMPTWSGLWTVIGEQRFVPFAPGVSGPWLFMRPHTTADAADLHSRWVHEHVDDHFVPEAA